ncbi:glycosyltransferase family 2 protein [Peribacillus psychrosaccharolyticus]|uniref:Glycosyltransferase family 2 protein n=1 Tax=Peribacillus psychrosaccharolyticus TaxID=1407 RepID=A0A974NN19_PERPY|nr:glycosyltransferase family A protein [Peribacillus psychrosaccharolyticus]MEC2056065.1 glycosyltransferase family A protein [Peribacillus psychrosaccharolyticus]MED3745506.1 glycosyltransferase family A protein [Peribacillus psychrosaccharolyticus]QQT00738.1 glycosyltransferase family 2 protein [Peribacillus psychrosaccharolyticus]
MTPTLTIFTPTFNRAYTLHLCYESLKRQTSKDFIWLIIDDGSTDNTKELVNYWIHENLLPIRYHFQSNQGMHGAHNTAYDLIDTELNVCIDSDDFMPDEAVEKILTFWAEYGSDEFAGMAGLDASPKGQVIGTEMPKTIKESTLTDLYGKYKVKGDKKLVYRTELTKKTPPYPIFEGEKYGPLSYKYVLIDQINPLLLLNEVLCHVEYLPDGSSRNMINQYIKNPRGFSFFRKVTMKYEPSYKRRFIENVHYVSSSLLIKNKNYWFESPNKWTTILATPVGIALYFYINYTHRSTVLKQS